MGFIQELGTKAFGSRLKSFNDLLLREVVKVYKDQEIEFEPRWYTLFLLLFQKGEMKITDIALQLNQTHPSINQVVNILEKKGLVITLKKEKDNRRRYVKLSPKGKRLYKKISPLWKSIHQATEELLAESNPNFLEDLANMEKLIDQKSMYDRIGEKIKQDQYDQIQIVPYSTDYKKSFEDLNNEWLEKFFEVEDYDKQMLQNPESIINKGGNIYFALLDGKAVGTVAIIHHTEDLVELAKMAVTPKHQGKQIGHKLLDSALAFAKAANYKKMILFSSTKLEKAIKLYKANGFSYSNNEEKIEHNFNRCTISMEMNLNNITN
jgi:DNA-binding MarR family transcriptional regulator/N-acetylglutamate synthase-like GNAT family acetyltransferase